VEDFTLEPALKQTALFGHGAEVPMGNSGMEQLFLTSSSPVQIGALTTGIRFRRVQRFTASVKTDGTFWAWGDNARQLGRHIHFASSSPVQIGALTTWSYVAVVTRYVLRRRPTALFGLGVEILRRQLGEGTTVLAIQPCSSWVVDQLGQSFLRSTHTFSVKTDGTLWAWGAANNGSTWRRHCCNKSSPVQIGAFPTGR
jgi:alpha-tubulin suppressor-like RCC1 family protein